MRTLCHLLTLRIDTAFGLTIGKRRMNRLDNKAKFVADHSEKKNHSLFIDWSVPKPRKLIGGPN